MSKSLVSVSHCKTYSPGPVGKSIDAIIDSLGGFEKYFTPDSHVFIKPNMLLSARPEKAVTTHPEVLIQLISRLQEYGARVSFGDLPGGFHAASTKKVHRETGMEDVAKKTGAELVVLEKYGFREVEILGGEILGSVHIPRYLDEVDAVINVCKAKTHMQSRYTGAVKNMFGLVTTRDRLKAHRHSKYDDFSEALVDIFTAVTPTLNFADAIVGMEGTGPSQGTPVKLGFLAASEDAAALDVTVAKVMGFSPREIGTIEAARRRGLGATRMSDIELRGDPIEPLLTRVRRPSNAVAALMPLISGPFSEWMSVRPFVRKRKCKKCRTCVEVCPNDAIRTSGRNFEIDEGRCIKCFCCHELCPHDAIGLKKPLLVRLAEMMK